jgi:phytoene synthase
MSTTAPPDKTLDDAAQVRLERSRQFCRALTRSSAKNFYYGLRLLSEPRRSAMFALYAYMRYIDDIADDDDARPIAQRETDLEQWRVHTHAAIRGELLPDAHHDLWPAFAQMVQQYQIPPALFDDAIAGQRQDLRPVEPATFEELREYCYRVAGVVGVASIHIWGFAGGDQTIALAIDRGVAFQLTNILRDVREDAARGRIYLPREDLTAANLTDQDVLAGSGGEKFTELIRFQAARAESLFEKSEPLDHRIERDARPTLAAMTGIYRGILKKIAADPQRILQQRVSLSTLAKLRIAWRATRFAKYT